MFRPPLRFSAVCAATLLSWTLLDSAASAQQGYPQQDTVVPAVVYTSAAGNCEQGNSGNGQSENCKSGQCDSCDSAGCDQCRGGKGGLLHKCLRACGLGGGGGQCLDCQSSTNDLFYNYYVPADCEAQMPAMMYQAPHPTPTVAGRVYYTYQPLLPHEQLYSHCRLYRNHYDCNRGLNRTFVKYQVGAGYAMKNHLKWAFYLPR